MSEPVDVTHVRQLRGSGSRPSRTSARGLALAGFPIGGLIAYLGPAIWTGVFEAPIKTCREIVGRRARLVQRVET